MIKGLFNIPWLGWAAIALLVAIIFTFVWPHKAMPEAGSIRYFAVRWAHALTWYLLAISFLLRGLSPDWNGAANIIAIAGGLTYLFFLLMTFAVK